jgi:hypothetical protein
MIQEKMGKLWQDRLIQPALLFFNEAADEWKFSTSETGFRSGLRGRMAKL